MWAPVQSRAEARRMLSAAFRFKGNSMSKIIAGHFALQDQVQRALDSLRSAGFAREQINSFYVNPAGQHDLYPLGGDRDKSPGAKQSDRGMVAGAASGGVLGAALGLSTVAVTGPVGPAVGALLGAHIGSLIGSLSRLKESGEEEAGNGQENMLPQRHAGMLVAVGVAAGEQEARAVAIFRECGALAIEHAFGTIENGDWVDFDPRLPPLLDPS